MKDNMHQKSKQEDDFTVGNSFEVSLSEFCRRLILGAIQG